MKTRLIGRFRLYKEGAWYLPPEWLPNRPVALCNTVIDNPTLSKEIKTKIAMLDLMDELEELPCRSKKVIYTTFTSYWIYGPVLKYRPARRRDDEL